jgi:dCMP deaminase
MHRDGLWWHHWFLGLARYVSTASKDPSTKTGAVIIDGKRRVVSVGYNGFPRGVVDAEGRYAHRETKLQMVVHCERNALLFASRPLDGCTIYLYPFSSCAPCAAMVIQAGIARVVAPPCPPDLARRWGEDLANARTMFGEAGVDVLEVTTET